ncbi:PAS domain-containing sensor histidine kinase [Flavobacterium album]|uniref:histidine kinase n=1 Tax=Flavobacterium album TaxID=2175091 RepID=A0A2S1QVD2_9FLAO|nr:PAS domain S-box protein [Flavobacterium album]AWH84309.1 PAS domain-containing sensor histidine kinase [Flavobacterium album]
MENADNSPVSSFPGLTPHSHPANYISLLEAMPTPIYICDMDGRITFFNPAATKFWGIAPEKGVLWHMFMKIFNPDGSLLTANDCPVNEVLRENHPVRHKELIIERHNGVRHDIKLDVQPLLDTAGSLTGILCIITDITHKKLEDALQIEDEGRYRSLSQVLEKMVAERTLNLKKSEERYHKMIEEVQDYAIILLDHDGYILNWNLGAQKIKGYTEEEIIGKNFRIFYQKHDQEGKLPEKLITRALYTGRATHEGWRVRKDGSTFWGSVVITALHDDENNIIGFTKVTRDLTERKLADDRMQNYALEIEFRNKQLEEYAYIASHDLQEPLRKIQIFAEMLETNISDPEKAKKQLEKINLAAKRMSSLIKDVLKYSQLSRADELFEDVSLNTVIASIKDDFELLIEQKQVVIVQNDLPVLKGIPIQLNQLFANLINNSIKFSSDNPVIEIYSENAGIDEISNYPGLNHSQGHVKISVKDNGVGFEQQYGEQVFRMFKRLTDNSGTGIGLALCKKIVENHNGHISVSSEPGKGTEFTILLPVG